MDKKPALTYRDWGASVLYEMNVRQLTPEGTLRAAAGRLEFLRATGVDAVWLMPIYPIGIEGRKGTLGSYYSIRDYKAVNPEFGTADDLDFFVAKAHGLGMRVILDWVANHTARDARWLGERPYDWYERDDHGTAVAPFDWTDTAKLDYSNRAVWEGQIDAMRYWLEKHDIDGFRCDMAMLVPIGFWQAARAELQKIRLDLFMLAEAEELNLFDAAFDASYAWELHHALCDIAQGKADADRLRSCIYADRERYPARALRMMFTSNHDENSWNGTEFERLGAAAEIMAVLTFMLPQSLPLIYTGQEFGCNHRFAFFDRDTMPAQSPNRWTELYRLLAELKHDSPALLSGAGGGRFAEIANNAGGSLLTFGREKEGRRVVCIMNLSPHRIRADFATGEWEGRYRDAVGGGEFILYDRFCCDLAPWDYFVLAD